MQREQTSNSSELQVVASVLIALSFGILTFLLSLSYKDQFVIQFVSVIFSICIVFFVLVRMKWWKLYDHSKLSIKIISAVIAYFSVDIIKRRFYADGPAVIKHILNCGDTVGEKIYWIFLAISIIALFTYYLYLFDYIYRTLFEKVFLSLNRQEKLCFYTFIVIMLIISFVHFSNSGFDYGRYVDGDGNIVTKEFDAMMDCDSLATQWQMRHFDFLFRHPMFAINALPDYSIARALGYLFPHYDQAVMFLVGLFNIVRLAFCGILLTRLTKTNVVLPFYYLSFPVIFYSLAIERHTWMTFWNVLMVFMTLESLKQDTESTIDYMPIYQAGASNLVGVVIALPTLGLTERSLWDFIKRGIKLALSFIVLLVLTGNLGGLLDLPDQIVANSNFVRTVNVVERFAKYTHALKNCFGGIEIYYGSWYSTFYKEMGVSYLGIIIAVLLIFASVILWANKFARVCTCWLMISVALFPLIGFSSEDFSMHMILFSWATISLVVMFGEKLYKDAKSKWMRYGIITVGAALLMWQFTANFATLTELLSYASRFNYVN